MAATLFICTNCDAQSPKWAGRCLECGSWGTLSQGLADEKKKPSAAAAPAEAIPFSKISHDDTPRRSTGIGEVDQVLGGGIVPGSLILLGGEPGIGKCVTADTRILDPSSGAFLPIGEWEKADHPVISLNQETYKLAATYTAAFHSQGVRPIIMMTTRLGKSLRCTNNHPLLTPDGWKQVKNMRKGDRIASPRSLPFFGSQSLEDHKIKCIAYVLSDGSTSGGFSVTAAIPEIWNDLESIAKKFNVSLKIYEKKNNRARSFKFAQPWEKKGLARKKFVKNLLFIHKQADIPWAEWARKAGISYGALRKWRDGGSVPSKEQLERLANSVGIAVDEFLPNLRDGAERVPSIMRFIESVGLRSKRAATKTIPPCIFLLSRQQLALFLKTLFSCDGSLYVSRENQAGISYSTISKTLAHDIQHLLLRFGFVARLRTKYSTVNNRPYVAYELQILGTLEVKRFIDEIGIFGRNRAKQHLSALSLPTIPSTQRDTIPTGLSFWQSLEEITGGISYKKMSRQCGMTIHTGREERPLTRSVITALADTYSSPFLQRIAYNDIYWDEVDNIVPAGEEEVYDISVPCHQNFVANDLIIHNSTLLGQIACTVSRADHPVIYCSGEESAQQVKMRFDRLGSGSISRREFVPDPLLFIGETNCEKICSALRHHKPALVIVDSIQTIASSDVPSEAGSVAQVRACTVKLLEVAKQENIPIIITGHVTKEGGVAGPKTLEHLVDTVLYLEGDASQYFRILKTVKNRFGSTNEIGVFEMTGAGLVEVTNPSELFLSSDHEHAPGTATTCVVEGSRAFLVPIQALTSKTYFGYPQRKGIGVDANRLGLLVAVLSKRLGVNLGDQDIHVNVVGGLKITEPAADLAICASILSSYKNKPLEKGAVLFGEVGLTGEVRPVSHTDKRLKEAEKLGFATAYTPKQTKKLSSKLHLVEIKTIRELEI